MPARQGRPPKYLQVVFFMAIQYKRILLKVSGEALSGPKGTGFDEETIASICAGIKAAQFVVDHTANVLITVRGGENAAEVLLAADIQIYKAQGRTARENLAAFTEGKLEKLESFHAGFHHKQ